MYRDELAAFRTRYDLARAAVDEARARLREQLELVATLREQMNAADLRAPNGPTVDEGPDLSDAPLDTGAKELVELAARAEAEATRLTAARDAVAQLAVLMNRQIMGEDVVVPLGPAPRAVPWTYVLAEAARWWAVVPAIAGLALALVVRSDAPSDAWVASAISTGPILVFAVSALFRARFLARCRQAVAANVIESGSDGSKMTNWPVATSKGWDVKVEGYSGYGKRDIVQFLTDDGRTGSITLKSSGYGGGVVLFDPATLRAYDVKQLACRPHPLANGVWDGSIGVSGWIRSILYVGALGGHSWVLGLTVGSVFGA